jgi:hypothetical protein
LGTSAERITVRLLGEERVEFLSRAPEPRRGRSRRDAFQGRDLGDAELLDFDEDEDPRELLRQLGEELVE